MRQSDSVTQKVSVGILVNAEKKILISKRTQASSLAGLWEFPGGKCERDETPQAALSRELKEEIGVVPLEGECIHEQEHTYSHDKVKLYFYWVTHFSGVAKGLEDQEIAWVSAIELSEREFPKGNEEVIAKILYRLC